MTLLSTWIAAFTATVTFAAGDGDTWPGFRGTGDSHSMEQELPWSWELRGQRAGNWTLRLPGYGQSSPVVWHDRIFVTAVSGDEKDQLHVLAVSLAEGKVLWQRDFRGTQKVKDSDTVSRGAPTPAVDEERLYAVFESGDVFALAHSGELLWQRSFVNDFGEIKGPHGYASSPVLVDDLCVLQVAHSGPSYILALDRATGQDRWRTGHPSQTGWSTPAVLRRADRNQLVVSTAGSVRALEASTGAEVWNISELQGNSTASPTVAGDFILIGASTEPSPAGRGRGSMSKASEFQGGIGEPNLTQRPAASPTGSLALKVTQEGPLAAPSVVWKSPKVSAGYASPVVLDGLAYFINRVGVVQCVDVDTGAVQWQHRLPGEVWSSPIANSGHVTFFCKHGQVVTLKGGRELVEVAESQVSTTDIVYGVAAVKGAWIVRTGRGLARIGGKAAESAPPPATRRQ
jgi:outer membrane protein assembly factor BamB